MEVLPSYLFGPYIIEIHKFFTDRFKSNITWDTMAAKSLAVSYGTPRAAFRYQQSLNNGKIILPMLNFYIADAQRVIGRERVNVFLYSQEAYDPVDNTIAATRNPQHWNLSFSFNLWTNNMRERDFIMHNILQAFPMGEVSLIHYRDRTVVNGVETVINDRRNYLLVPLRWDGGFNDETNIEGLEMTETRDAIKTVWNIKIDNAMVHYDIEKIPVVQGDMIGVYSEMMNNDQVVSEQLI